MEIFHAWSEPEVNLIGLSSCNNTCMSLTCSGAKVRSVFGTTRGDHAKGDHNLYQCVQLNFQPWINFATVHGLNIGDLNIVVRLKRTIQEK